MAGRRSGADPVLSGILERPTPHNSPVAIDPVGPDAPAADPTAAEPLPAVRGRGALAGEHQVGDNRTVRRIRGRTIYLPDDLFERILVQAHRRDRTISEYVADILERQVPDHRVARAEPVSESSEAGAA
jgi:hypothetical protein